VNSTLASKFGNHVQRWSKAGLGEGGAVENHGGEGTHVEYGRWGPT
jgi:hypothetical protein